MMYDTEKYEELRAAYEACKTELAQVRGDYKVLLNSTGQMKATIAKKKHEVSILSDVNARLRKRNKEILAVIRSWGIGIDVDEDGIFEIGNPDLDVLAKENSKLREQLKEADGDAKKYRALCGKMLDASDEIRRIADVYMPKGGKGAL